MRRRYPPGFESWAKQVLQTETFAVLPHHPAWMAHALEAFRNREKPMINEALEGRPAVKTPRGGYRVLSRMTRAA